MNKRGQGLPLNTLIIIILVVLVLIVVAIFFLGGTSSLSESVRRIFFGTTAGTDINLAREICENRCAAAQTAPSPGDSAYCKTPFELDTDGDGKADTDASGYIKYYCHTGPISVACPEVTC